MGDSRRLKKERDQLKAELANRPSPEDVARWLDEESGRLARGGSGLDAAHHRRIAQVIRYKFGPKPSFPCQGPSCERPGLCTALKRCGNAVPKPKPSDPMPEDISLTNE